MHELTKQMRYISHIYLCFSFLICLFKKGAILSEPEKKTHNNKGDIKGKCMEIEKEAARMKQNHKNQLMVEASEDRQDIEEKEAKIKGDKDSKGKKVGSEDFAKWKNRGRKNKKYRRYGRNWSKKDRKVTLGTEEKKVDEITCRKKVVTKYGVNILTEIKEVKGDKEYMNKTTLELEAGEKSAKKYRRGEKGGGRRQNAPTKQKEQRNGGDKKKIGQCREEEQVERGHTNQKGRRQGDSASDEKTKKRKQGVEGKVDKSRGVKERKPIRMSIFFMVLLGLPPIINASVIISPSHDYTTFENSASNFTFNCSGNGTALFWIVDNQTTGSSYVLNKGIQYTPFIVSLDELTTTSKLIVPTTKANKNITVICVVLNSSFIHQTSNPVELILQGILPPPQQLKINFSNSTMSLFWVAPDSFQVSTPPTISHYVLSNNLTNGIKTFNNPTTCNPLASCNYSLDLRDPFFTSVGSYGGENTIILEYNGTILFTFFAVNGAGNGNATTYMYIQQRKTSTAGNISHTAAAMTTNILIYAIIIAVASVIGVVILLLTMVLQCGRKRNNSATFEGVTAKNNEYITQSTFVTQLDDPYFVHVPRHLHRHEEHNQISRTRSQLHQDESTQLDAYLTPPMRELPCNVESN